ncbi:MAG: HAD-IIB family hydrolase [Actinobacteria bacterium]|nr:HAD-IIB family hydrolase [Actinomycetota bacterium]
MANKKQNKYRLFSEYKTRLKEELKDLKVIYTDLDGTLVNDQGCVIKDVNGKFYFEGIKLFEKITRNNWDIVLVSGRSKVQLRYNAMLIGVKNYIPELGCEMVYNLGEKVFIAFDNSKYKYEITNGGKDLVRIIKLFKKYFPGKIDSNLDWSIGRTYNALFFGEIDVKHANEILGQNGYEGLVLVDNGFSKLVNLNLNVRHLRIYNLVPKGVDKSSAIKLDKKIRGLENKNCIALGDSIEDLKMAKEVYAFFLMRDAVEKNKEILELIKNHENVYITTKSMNRGWVEVIKYLAQ